ncbi:Ltp family lipoprotein [Agromyces sp. NPDC049794]|uniref:Ltp family lipoprotein n=1 Tax=unclassified Agromyces TaxID=2639701 RepID=UPI0033DA87CF
MTEPVHHKPGDIVNGHRLTEQPDGSRVWLPVNAAPEHEPAEVAAQYKPGDVVNGHRLTDQDGTLKWSPVVEAEPKKSRRGEWIAWGVSAAAVFVLLTVGIVSVITADRPDSTGAEAPSVEVAEPEQQPEAEPEPEPEMVTIPSTIVGMTAASATAALKGIGLVVNYSGPGDATVTASDPAQGAEVEEGTVITFTVQEKPKLTLAQENALQQAQQYLSLMPFSRQGLIDQMSSQYGSGYPVDVATWAVDYLNPDWNSEAAEAAKSYLEVMAFSRDGLYEQLTSEYGSQFTPEQANAGLAAVGY